MNYCIHLKKRKNKPYCNIIRKEITLSQCRECDNKEYKKSTLKGKSPVKSGTMKNKSSKLAKLERNRFSVFTSTDKCFICGTKYQLTWNEIYRGRNRPNSMQDGFCLRMCLNCHRKYQDDVAFNEFWHRKAQLFYEKNIGSREQFLARYRRNYLE